MIAWDWSRDENITLRLFVYLKSPNKPNKRSADNLGILATKPIYQITQFSGDIKLKSQVLAALNFEYITIFSLPLINSRTRNLISKLVKMPNFSHLLEY